MQIYESLKLIKHIDQKAAVKEIVQTITEALTALDEAKASLVDQPQKTAEVEGSDDQALATNTDISEPSERKVQTKARASDMRNSLDSGDCFDTPRDTTKAEQKRVFSTGCTSLCACIHVTLEIGVLNRQLAALRVCLLCYLLSHC